MRFSPAVGARQVALVDHGRHLHAVVAGHTVELPFVALAVAQQRFLGPVARFDATVLAHDVVALLLQFGFQLRVHSCHSAHSWSHGPRLAQAGWGWLGWMSGGLSMLSKTRLGVGRILWAMWREKRCTAKKDGTSLGEIVSLFSGCVLQRFLNATGLAYTRESP